MIFLSPIGAAAGGQDAMDCSCSPGRKRKTLSASLDTVWKHKYEPFLHKLHSLAVHFQTHKIAPIASIKEGNIFYKQAGLCQTNTKS